VFHPVNDLTVLFFLNRDVAHCGSCRCAMPVLLSGLKPHYISWTDVLDRTAVSLHPSCA
jgi:hypothetical protein